MGIRKFILKTLIKNNFNLITTLDIGAALDSTFEFSLMSKKSIRVDGREESIHLSSNDTEVISFISNKDEETFYELKKSTCSSILKPNFDFLNQYPKSERFEIISQSKVKTKKLSDLIQENTELRGIKIDVQGAELKVLKSAGNFIKQIEFLEIETSFRNMYDNGSTFSDVYNYLTQNNFFLLDIRKQYWSNSKYSVSGDLIWCDCLFVRNDISKETNDLLSLSYGFLHRISKETKNKNLKSIFLFNILKLLVFFNNIFNKNYIFNSPLSNCSEKKIGF